MISAKFCFASNISYKLQKKFEIKNFTIKSKVKFYNENLNFRTSDFSNEHFVI